VATLVGIDIAPLHVGHGLSACAHMHVFLAGAGFLKPKNKWSVHKTLPWKCKNSMRIFVRSLVSDFRKRLSACDHLGRRQPTSGVSDTVLHCFLFKSEQKIIHNANART
jgi:hypothetical protein